MSNNNSVFSNKENPTVLSKSTESIEEMGPKLSPESKVNKIKPKVKGDTKKEVKPSPSFSPKPAPVQPLESPLMKFWRRLLNK